MCIVPLRDNTYERMMFLMNTSENLIISEAKAYSKHYMLNNRTQKKLVNDSNASVSSILADLYYGSNDFDAAFYLFESSMIDYHPCLVALVGYFDYWYSHTTYAISDDKDLMEAFYHWLIHQDKMHKDVIGLATFIIKDKDHNNYWHDKIIEDVFRHFKDFMLAFMDEQYIGSMPGASVSEIKEAIIMTQDAYDYSSYFSTFFQELTSLFAYFGYWHSNYHHSTGHKKVFTVQFPEWLKSQPNINSRLLEVYASFASWYPKRKIVKGRNYNNWGYNV